MGLQIHASMAELSLCRGHWQTSAVAKMPQNDSGIGLSMWDNMQFHGSRQIQMLECLVLLCIRCEHGCTYAGAVGAANTGTRRAPDLRGHPWQAFVRNKDVAYRVDSVSDTGQQECRDMYIIFSQATALAYPRYLVTYK